MADYPWLKSYPAAIPWDIALQTRSLPSLLEEAANLYGTKSFLQFSGKKYGFSDVYRKASAFARGLQKKGVGRGVKVGLFMPNCPQFVIAYYGILLAGGTVVNFNPLYSPREIAGQIHDAGVKMMVTLNLRVIHDKLAEVGESAGLETIIVSGLQEALPFPKNLLFSFVKRKEIAAIPNDGRHMAFASLLRNSGSLGELEINPDQDVAVLQYTGGTTGIPKAAMLTHGNLYANTVQIGYWFEGLKAGEERMIAVLPLFHVFAMTAVMNLSIHKGIEMILHPRVDLNAVLKDIHEKKPTLMMGVPTLFAALANHRSLKQYDLTSIKMCISGGAPLPLEVKQRFEQVTGCKLVEGYGLSESSPVAACNPLFGQNKPGSIGLPIPRTIIEIIDPEDKKTPKPMGEIGEICIRGPQVMKGYWNRADETAEVLRSGRLYTGDLGKIDEEGYIFVVDRLKELILSGGYNIYPRHVEEALYRHADVAEVAVIGVAHPSRGQVVKAYVVRKPEAQVSEHQLRVYLKDELAAFEVPSSIEFRDSLPKTMIGKIDKKALVAEAKG